MMQTFESVLEYFARLFNVQINLVKFLALKRYNDQFVGWFIINGFFYQIQRLVWSSTRNPTHKQNYSLPSSRLRIDNQLFIEKNYIPAKTQEYSLNGKLRQLKRDYTEFQTKIDQLTKMRVTPKRSQSRKGKQQSFRSSTFDEKTNENTDSRGPKVPVPRKLPPTNSYKYDIQQQKKQLLNDMLKRESWIKDEQTNILKHSELDHIFSNKLNKVYDLDDIKPSTLPKPAIDYDYSLDSKKHKQNFTIKQRSKQNLQNKSGLERSAANNVDDARGRREKAKNNLQFRRKKLQQLLRTLW